MSLIHGTFINNNAVSVHMSSPKKLVIDAGEVYEGTVDSYYLDIGTITKLAEVNPITVEDLPLDQTPVVPDEPKVKVEVPIVERPKRRGRKPSKKGEK